MRKEAPSTKVDLKGKLTGLAKKPNHTSNATGKEEEKHGD